MGSRSIITRWKPMGYSKGLGPLRTRQGEAGFTLVELLLALFLFALIAGVIFAAFAAVARGVERGRERIGLYSVGRVALLHMVQGNPAAMQPPGGIDTTVETNLGFHRKK